MLAIQETALPGSSLDERLATAARYGIQALEFDAEGLTARVPAIAAALQGQGIRAAGVHLGRVDGYLSPILDEREAAIGRLRQAMADAVDLGTSNVIFVPHYGPLRMPDLRPYRSSLELTREMMLWLLRTVSDLAYAMDVTLHIQPRSHHETQFMRRLDQAVGFCNQIKRHPHIRIAPSWSDMLVEEADPLAALQAAGDLIGYVHMSTMSQSELLLQGLRSLGYAGCVTVTLHALADDHRQHLPAYISQIQDLGFIAE